MMKKETPWTDKINKVLEEQDAIRKQISDIDYQIEVIIEKRLGADPNDQIVLDEMGREFHNIEVAAAACETEFELFRLREVYYQTELGQLLWEQEKLSRKKSELERKEYVALMEAATALGMSSHDAQQVYEQTGLEWGPEKLREAIRAREEVPELWVKN